MIPISKREPSATCGASQDETVSRPPADGPDAPSSDDRLAAELRRFGPLGIAAMLLILLTGNVFVGNMVIVPVGAFLVLIWVWRSRTPWREIGYVRPRN